ncbi:MAG: hypothetical protein ACXW20_18070 [Burkholderiales bacterium]
MNRISQRLNAALSLLGPLGIVGIGLLICAAAAYVGWVVPTREEVSGLENKVLSQQQRARTPAPGPAMQQPLSDFYEFFPPAETSAQWLGKVYAVAERERLDLPKGEYRLTSQPGEAIATYEAVFALRGRYQQLRAFIAGVLEEIPFAALDDVRLERQRTADSTVDARLRLTFFLRTR